MHQNAEAAQPSSPAGRPPHERIIVGIFLALMVLPQLLFSSQEYIERPRFIALFAIAGFSFSIFPHRWTELSLPAKILIIALLIVHAASWYGGFRHGHPGTFLAASGIVSVLGFAALLSVLLEPRWRSFIRPLGVGVLVTLLAVSLGCYFIHMERYMRIGEWTVYFEPIRLVLIWPGRLAMSWAGQVGWEHTNFAALLFGIGLVMTLEFIAGGTQRRNARWWLLVIALGAAVFLTGSRGGWAILVAALPVVLFRRRWDFSVKVLLACALALAAGLGGLKIKHASLRQEPPAGAPAVAPPPISDIHLTGLMKRGTTGRLTAYRVLWEELADSRAFGQGLATAAQPMAQLMHEHSSYLATIRSGGFVAFAAHLAILLTSLIAAVMLFLKNCRWPLVLLVTVLTAILFDHSNVFAIGGRYDFLIHWTAVLIPVLLVSQRKPTAQIGGT